MDLGQLRGPSWLTGTPFAAPIRSLLSRTADWKSVMNGPYVGDEKNLEIKAGLQVRRLQSKLGGSSRKTAMIWLSGPEFSSMNINLTPEQERLVNDELRSGHFQSAEEVIAKALAALREKEGSPLASDSNGRQDEAVREMLNFVETNRTSLQGISVKQLIREGHRL